MNKLLVICTGNICRSPVCEILFAHRLTFKYPEVSVSSAGLGALVAHPADSVAQELMLERGLDISHHRARQLTSEILFASDLILTMTQEQQKNIEECHPEVLGRVHRLGKWSEFDVPDPYKRPRAIFEQALAMMEQGVNDWCERMWK